MAGIALTPGVLGAALSVQDSTALAAYPINGVTLGTLAYNVVVAKLFRLVLSTAALVTDQVVAVSGVSGARWVVETTITPTFGYHSISVTVPTASLTIDVTAGGDGQYLFGFDGTMAANASTPQSLKIQINGLTPPSGQGNYVQNSSNGALASGATTGGDVVLHQPSSGGTDSTVGVKGMVGSDAGLQGSLSSSFVGADGANWSGYAVGQYTPAAVLTSLTLISTKANGLTAGKFWVSKIN